MSWFSHGYYGQQYCSWAHTHDDDDDDDDGDDDRVAQYGGHTPNNRLTEICSLGLLFTTLILDIHVMINWHLSKQGICWPVSRDHIADTISQAQVYSSLRSRVFWSWPLTKCWFSIGWRAHVRLTCWKQGRIVRKPVNATCTCSPGLKFIQMITFSSIQMFFAALFWVYGDYKTQNRKSNSKQKTALQSYKTQINILPFPGLAQLGTQQPGQGAMLLGWPKSIYYIY